jgi:sulfite reductase (ferredoxin)
MRWWGLYTQRKPGIDGGRTAALEPEELDDRYFMLRVRIDGGALTTEQLRAVGEISRDHGRGTADVTDRQNIQYHWIEIESMPAIWAKLEGLGLLTTEACGDTPRVILGSPVAGISADEKIDPKWAIDTILDRYIGSPEFSNLPRKFKTAISWQQDVAHEVNDVSFIGVEHPEHGPGFDVWVGGGLSTNPKIAQRLGTWVPLEDVPDVWAGIISIFRDYGYRRLRHRARIKFLIADWGAAEFRRVLEQEYLGTAAADGPAPADPRGADRPRRRAQAGRRPQLRRRRAGVRARLGQHPDRAGRRGRGRRVGPGAAHPPAEDRRAGRARRGRRGARRAAQRARPAGRAVAVAARHHGLHRHRVLQAGDRRDQGAGDPPGRRPGEAPGRRAPDVPISIHLNGCPNSCARTQVADIGLKGQIVTDAEGNQVEGFQVHLGGGLGLDAGFGRKLRGLKVTSAELGEYVDRIVRRFVEQRGEGERFAQWVLRAEEADLR